MKMTIGNFLFMRLQQIGVGHVFGVPGDFNLQLLEQIKEVGGIDFIGTCNELNAAYAADGYARTNGIGALLTTYGVGDLSAVCGIAGSCAEHVPVVFISGVPPLYAIESRLRRPSLASRRQLRQCHELPQRIYRRGYAVDTRQRGGGDRPRPAPLPA